MKGMDGVTGEGFFTALLNTKAVMVLGIRFKVNTRKCFLI